MNITIGYDSDPGLLGVRPVLKDLSDVTLILDADILNNRVSPESHVFGGCVTHETLRTSIDVGIVETRIADSRGIDQRSNFGEVLSTKLVENVDVRILELS